ncbi:hypothetical protein [uncultured Shewanella sp.]|uniref:hypothetical protein n=1 Tax=uncultured Shewanella sp. TaxID=173975 RepID=UPI00262A5A84|nr:hypothetical protein [uncultured Shewanella sp.]
MHNYDTFCAVIRKHRISSLVHYNEFVRSGHVDANNLPKQPQVQYRNKGYITFNHAAGFEGKENGMLTIKEAMSYVEKLGINSPEEWREAVLTGKIKGPLHPSRIKGFSNYSLFFKKKEQNFVTDLATAALIVQDKLPELDNSRDWVKACELKQRPENIPSNPQAYYRDQWMLLKSQYNYNEEVSFWDYFLTGPNL